MITCFFVVATQILYFNGKMFMSSLCFSAPMSRDRDPYGPAPRRDSMMSRRDDYPSPRDDHYSKDG